MAIGLNEKTLDFRESQGLKFSETDSPLALFYVVAISLNSVEPGPKSIHVFDSRISLPSFAGKGFLTYHDVMEGRRSLRLPASISPIAPSDTQSGRQEDSRSAHERLAHRPHSIERRNYPARP